MNQHIRTDIRDAILAAVSEGLDADAVQAVEWAAARDTVAAVRRREPALPGRAELVDFDTYNEVAL